MPRRRPKRLTDLELEIMQVIWDASPAPLTVRDVVDRMGRGRPPAYTTIQTTMNILTKKGVLASGPGPGRAHEYRARLTRAEATSSMTADFVERLFRGSAEPLLAQLLEHDSLDRDTLEELKRRIETQLRDDVEPDGPTGPGGEARGGGER